MVNLGLAPSKNMRIKAVGLLAERWRAAGINRGDAVLLHSSLKRTARELVAAGHAASTVTNDILDSFLAAIGAEGTLLLPLFNFDFTKGAVFDIRSTPSHMGALTEAGRLRTDAVRTGHPIYSFAVLGRQRDKFRTVRNFSGYGPDSPFAMLHAMGGRIAILDLPDQNSMTFYHYVEESEDVGYRYHKRFDGACISAGGVTTNETFGLFVRNIERGVRTHVDPMGELLWEKALYRGDRPGTGSGLRVIDAVPLYDAVSAIIRSGQAEGMLFRIEP